MIKSKAGFTLIEILVVVIIIGILAATALLYYGRFIERMRMTEALQLFGTALAAQERNMLKKYRYTDMWEYLDVIPMQLSTGELNPKYYDTERKIYFTNGSGPDGDSGIGSFRPGYKVYFVAPGSGENSSSHWFIKAERIGGGVYSEHYYLVRAFDSTKIYCIPDEEHADSVTLCMDFMGVSTAEELEPDPMTASGELGAHDNLASAGGTSGTGSGASGEASNEPAGDTSSDVEGVGSTNSEPNAFDMEGGNEGDNEASGDAEGINATAPEATTNESGEGSETPANNNADTEPATGDSGTGTGAGPSSENAGNDSGAEANPATSGNDSGTNTDSGNNSGNSGNPNAGPGNNSGANSGNENAGTGNNSGNGNTGSGNNQSGSGGSSFWNKLGDAICGWTGWFC